LPMWKESKDLKIFQESLMKVIRYVVLLSKE